MSGRPTGRSGQRFGNGRQARSCRAYRQVSCSRTCRMARFSASTAWSHAPGASYSPLSRRPARSKSIRRVSMPAPLDAIWADPTRTRICLSEGSPWSTPALCSLSYKARTVGLKTASAQMLGSGASRAHFREAGILPVLDRTPAYSRMAIQAVWLTAPSLAVKEPVKKPSSRGTTVPWRAHSGPWYKAIS